MLETFLTVFITTPDVRENMKAELIDKYRDTDFIQSVIKSTIMNFSLFCFILFLICAVFFAPIEPINKEFIEPLYNKVDQLFSTFSL